MNTWKIAAVAGALAIASAPSVARADWYIEAETIQYDLYPYAVGYGWGANADAFLQLNWNGGPYKYFYVSTAGSYVLHARLAGSICSGYPVALFFIDAVARGRRPIGTGWTHQTSDAVWLEAGWHSFAVALENDYAAGGCDRNLWFDAAWMSGNTSI
ncbi:hypothetical protein [Sorangium sp. So ce341]|uniref:hypothetical protein n=1 Tax=Sorangium sp. So ce341 TaxID=3133302 RepID=UPI003F5F9FC2